MCTPEWLRLIIRLPCIIRIAARTVWRLDMFAPMPEAKASTAPPTESEQAKVTKKWIDAISSIDLEAWAAEECKCVRHAPK